MKILFVINNLYVHGNGLCASARRTIAELKKQGEDVRVLAGPNKLAAEPQPDFPLKEYKFPFFQGIIESNGLSYAESDEKVIEEAVRWADVVHLEEMFVLQWKVVKVAKRLGKPLTATYHLHPENIAYNIHPLLGYWKGFNRTLLRAWKKYVYDDCRFIQCPTLNVQDRLHRYHFKAETETISNGVIPDACIRPVTPPEDYLDPGRPLDVIYIGRLSLEKDQPTLLEAMRYSKYAKRIRLHFAGNGPKAAYYKKLADKLVKDGVVKYAPEFCFLNRDELRQLAAKADLCIHCATVEVEGLSIMEALQQAATPIIAVGRLSGTAQFALDRHCKFPERNPEALANRIDYWLARPEERWEMGFRHAKAMEAYDISKSVKALRAALAKATQGQAEEQ